MANNTPVVLFEGKKPVADEITLEERYESYPAALQAVAAFRELWAALDGCSPANDEEIAVLERWRSRVERALRALEVVDPVLLDGPLARQVAAAASRATAELAGGISAPTAEPTMDELHEHITRLASLAPGGTEARPLAHITDDATHLVADLRSQIEGLKESVAALEADRDRLMYESHGVVGFGSTVR